MALQAEHQQKRLQQFLALERKPPTQPPLRATNDVSDILGARPLLKDHMYVNKPHFYDAHDIRGSVSKELHPQNRRIGDDDRFKQLPIEGMHLVATSLRESGPVIDGAVNMCARVCRLDSPAVWL